MTDPSDVVVPPTIQPTSKSPVPTVPPSGGSALFRAINERRARIENPELLRRLRSL